MEVPIWERRTFDPIKCESINFSFYVKHSFKSNEIESHTAAIAIFRLTLFLFFSVPLSFSASLSPRVCVYHTIKAHESKLAASDCYLSLFVCICISWWKREHEQYRKLSSGSFLSQCAQNQMNEAPNKRPTDRPSERKSSGNDVMYSLPMPGLIIFFFPSIC